MSIYTPTKLYDGALGTASATLYTAAGTVIISEIILSNTSSSSATATLTIGSLQLVPAVSVAGNSIAVFDIKKVMSNGDALAGLGSTTAIDVFISGVVIS